MWLNGFWKISLLLIKKGVKNKTPNFFPQKIKNSVFFCRESFSKDLIPHITLPLFYSDYPGKVSRKCYFCSGYAGKFLMV